MTTTGMTMSNSLPRPAMVPLASGRSALAAPGAADAQQCRAVWGFAVHPGVIPAQILRGHTPGRLAETPPRSRAPRGVHRIRVSAAVYDEDTSARISDAQVSATMAGLGLAGSRIALDPMQIEGAVTDGGCFNPSGGDRCAIRIESRRPGLSMPVGIDFIHEHRPR